MIYWISLFDPMPEKEKNVKCIFLKKEDESNKKMAQCQASRTADSLPAL